MTARPIRRNAQTPDRNGKIFYTSTTSLSHISKSGGDLFLCGAREVSRAIFLYRTVQNLNATFTLNVFDVSRQLLHGARDSTVMPCTPKIKRLTKPHATPEIGCNASAIILMKEEVVFSVLYQIKGMNSFGGCCTVNHRFHKLLLYNTPPP